MNTIHTDNKIDGYIQIDRQMNTLHTDSKIDGYIQIDRQIDTCTQPVRQIDIQTDRLIDSETYT